MVDNGPGLIALTKAWHKVGYKIIVHEKEVVLREKEPKKKEEVVETVDEK